MTLSRNEAMSIDCRLFAVPEEKIQKLLARPALVIGRLALAGSPICELQNARQTLALLIAGLPGQVDESGISLVTGGMELGVAELDGPEPRLLEWKEVKQLNAALQRITGVELQRRFQQQCVGSRMLDAIDGETTIDWEDIPFPGAAKVFEDDWTLDQAEDFERISLQVETLKTFVAQTTGRREWLVIAMQDSE